ncbi:MAG: sodium:proton antiporter NhaD [Dysgonamonadaceae bacterium]|jgi:Na+/H+ antiporter NhaD/arsenite permease-like protein|nr:sodium:proton antiporter NhaD [Dysgonamonadaceae bacterium]
MFTLMIVVFIIGYVCIALEHPLHVNKTATALLLSTFMWVLFVMGNPASFPAYAEYQEYLLHHPDASFVAWITQVPLIEHLGEVAEILFFLLGAMTIVEIVDTHGGFRIITDKIHTTKKTSLLWIISALTFFMSAVLDNLTTSIVMIALLRKLIGNKKDRWIFAGMVILAANAGGAFSPIGDVTTIMLWIAGHISAVNIMRMTFLASAASILIPLLVLSFRTKGNVTRPERADAHDEEVQVPDHERTVIFFLGVGALLFVPVFKSLTHLPPYLGMLGGLGVLWVVTSFMHKKKSEKHSHHLSVNRIISRIDTPSILFFLGILMAVNALQTCGQLALLSSSLDRMPVAEPHKYYLISVLIGFFSSIIDNVPLVAGAMGMYHFPTDHYFWEFLAYTAGTGGSILIIGSAAGVAVMGMEKIDFIWYLKKISWLAILGYLGGCFVYILQKTLMG